MCGEIVLCVPSRGDRVLVKRWFTSYWHRASILREWKIMYSESWKSYAIIITPHVSQEELDEIKLPSPKMAIK
jgi:hypothetical protein